MDLRTFVFSARTTLARIGRDLNVSSAHLSAIANKRTKPSDRLAKDIEAYTKGIVTKADLFDGYIEHRSLEEFIESHAMAR